MEVSLKTGPVSEVRNEPLNSRHNLSGFDCGRDSLNFYLTRYALNAPSQGLAQTWVQVASDDKVLGYYTLTVSTFMKMDAPSRVAQGMPEYPIPCMLLARFAIDQSVQGQGLGRFALELIMRKALDLGRGPKMKDGTPGLPLRTLLVHAIDETAADFYRHHGFEPSPTDPKHLFFLLKDIEASFREA